MIILLEVRVVQSLGIAFRLSLLYYLSMYISVEALNGTPMNNLEQFEAWVSQDWVFARGSDEAQFHVRSKLREESTELAEVLASNDRQEIVSELGDFLWTATANGLNVGITSSDALRHELGSDQIGIETITLDRIDELAIELMPDLPVDQMADWIKYLSRYLGKAANQWRNLSPLINTDTQPQNLLEALIQLKLLRTYDAIAQSVLITSALAQRHAGATITDVVNGNVEKLQNRKVSGLPITSLSSDSR